MIKRIFSLPSWGVGWGVGWGKGRELFDDFSQITPIFFKSAMGIKYPHNGLFVLRVYNSWDNCDEVFD